MTDLPNSGSNTLRAWRQSRYGFVTLQFVFLLAAFSGLRLLFFTKFCPAGLPVSDVLKAFALGLHMDVVVALILVFPLVAWFAIVPQKVFAARFHRLFFLAGCFVLWSAQVFLLVAEYYFFEEFKSRFNPVAIDYLIYPHEVFVNIGQSYPVKTVVTASLGSALTICLISRWAITRLWDEPFSRSVRWFHVLGVGTLIAILVPTTSLQEARFNKERTLNEVANNGFFSLVAAAWSRNLDYSAFYQTIPQTEAYARARQILQEPNAAMVESGDSIRRHVSGDNTRLRYNVVLFLEESLGSEFWGCLGRKETLTPNLDKLAAEGMLFENLYATGNRTVRGFEGVLSSFPPLPGDSIVKRDRSQNVETIARVLKRDGYATEFLYGGRGVFDGMRSFAVNNGYDKFIEQKDFPNPTFTTAWGVCNEDLYARTLQEVHDLLTKGGPFFLTILSVSNHKPYTYPPGRIPEDPQLQKREYAVKYTDWALGKFFEGAKKEAAWTNTLFVVVADHGARVYGSQTIPIHSYEIPLLFLGPAFVKNPARVSQLGCQLDVAPTILGLLGRPYDTMFFGRDILNTPDDRGFVLLNHNRDIGMFKDNHLAILNLNKGAEFFHGNPKSEEMTRADQPDERDRALLRDATALFETADDLYMNRRYHVDP